jgi:5-methylcytosine-specific restriction enzyme A
MPHTLELVNSASDIKTSLQTFNTDALAHRDRVKNILATIRYWVHSENSFGPAKFVGFRDMDFDTYETALSGEQSGDDFDGHRTRVAIEETLGVEFVRRPELDSMLEEWAAGLVGEAAFGGANRSKWMFVELPAGRNPRWERDELILALDLYFQVRRRVPDDGEPEVIALSELLNALPIHADRPDQVRFRNPNGVVLKLANFRSLDQPGHGMSRGGKGDRDVWAAFSSDPAGLHRMAEAIRNGFASPAAQPAADDDEEAGFPEGRVVYRLHRARERNRALVERKKAAVVASGQPLACEACGFDFAECYGSLGIGYIECHHANPLSEVADSTTTKIGDLALVCSNCHRMIHRKRPWLTVGQIRHFVAAAPKAN